MKITISKEIKTEESAKEISRLTAPLYLEKMDNFLTQCPKYEKEYILCVWKIESPTKQQAEDIKELFIDSLILTQL